MVRGGYCAGITPEAYVRQAQSAINVVRDVAPLGRIENLNRALSSLSNNPNLG